LTAGKPLTAGKKLCAGKKPAKPANFFRVMQTDAARSPFACICKRRTRAANKDLHNANSGCLYELSRK
ncbi:hypothetical protein, partial [Stieleria sp.]|uniref:hypothetical protein n=1 Tax=Stieleria sp. TaxID=2795976 RepID=UPI0035641B6E